MLVDTFSFPKFKKIVLVIGLVVVLGGLFFFTYLSVYNRYWGDDWCYNADLRNRGLLGALAGYAYDVTYTPSRYSVIIFSGFLRLFEVAGVQWMTPLTILFWVAGLVWLFWNIARLAGLQPAAPLIIFISSLVVYFSIYLAPQLYQSLYWRSALLTYTTPLVLTTWVFVLITRQGLLENPSGRETVLAGILTLLAGGCSEAGTTVLVSSLAIYVGLAAFGRHRKQVWAQKTFWIAVVSMFFAIVAMCLLIFAPTTQVRRQRYGAPAAFAELPRLIFNYTYAFFVLSVKDYHYIIIALISALAGFTYKVEGERSFKFSRYILLDVIIVIVAILLVAASLTPSIYIERGLPAPRTMIIPRFIAVFGFAAGGWVAGASLRAVFRSNRLEAVAVVLLLMSFAFPAYTILKATNLISIYSQRAQAWDVRNGIIQMALSDGSSSVAVEAIDGLPVGGIRDFDPPDKKGHWITRCASRYYGIDLDVVLP